MSRRIQIAARLGTAALCAGLIAGLSACQKPAAAPPAAMFTEDHGLLSVPAASPLRSHLTVQPVGGAAGGQTLDLPASVEADPARVVNVVTPLTGRVLSLKVGLGDRVKRGQVLAVIASGDYAQANADVEKARDAADLAAKALTRARGVQAAGGAAGKDLEAAESADVQARAELARAQARLASLNGAGGHGKDLVLTAPQNGVVTSLAIAPGAQVSDPTATLMTVTNVDRVFVTANVAESDIGRAPVGAEADIVLTADPNRKLHGRISEANAVIEPDTRRQKVRIALANPDGRLMPNMYATVRLPAPAATGVSVPQSALLMNNDSISVLVEVRPWVFQRRAVQIGEETETAARVVSGLQPGERVVVRGGVLLGD
ncbi:efflux RND transporter periplasmic adaptor subunit [Phenylobacterium sp.]|uniref:efflux RND transporter periplasmic adaptor subunit n=1 Tax=Phenylobacterium sp. TaxID=1871053 RepID=UPI001207B61A|nr:efflux RND transporter periplasmic adaptor subunit [Phenylobacterium sp.]THD61292.1 MAG: efflux RND transporter periplasmic adaptor subunit [Phenylobacterium sp.]